MDNGIYCRNTIHEETFVKTAYSAISITVCAVREIIKSVIFVLL